MLLFLFWVLLLSAGGPQVVGRNSGTKVVLRHTSGDHTSEFTTYTMGDQRRTQSSNSAQHRNTDGLLEYAEPPADIRILRCDLGQSFELNTYAKEYTARAYPPKWLVPDGLAKHGLNNPEGAETSIPTVRIEITTVDTGERKEFFGHLARHVTTTVKQIHDEGWSGQMEESVTDGWYIDIDPRPSCEPNLRGEIKLVDGTFTVGGTSVRLPRGEFVEIGARERGFAVKEARTPTSITFPAVFPRNSSGSIYEFEVTQLVKGPLDPALFEVPPGFKRVERIQ